MPADDPPPGSAPSPIPAQERLELVDALRGVALLGVLLVNVGYFSHPSVVRMSGLPPGQGVLNDLVAGFLRIFVEGKFYPLFSLLFGFGLFIQMNRAAERGAAGTFARRWARRLLVLLGIGVVHGVLIWAGDVLSAYALLGFAALRFRRTEQRRLVVWAVRLVLAIALFVAALAGLLALVPSETAAGPDPFAIEIEEAYRIYGSGSYGEVLRLRAREFGLSLASWALLAPAILAMFALGIWVGRTGLLRDPAVHRPLLRRILMVSLLIGVPTNAAYLLLHGMVTATQGLPADDFAPMLGGMAAVVVAGPAICLAYLSMTALLWLRPGPRRALQVLAPAGRMALTNYLMQSVICTMIFYGYGLGLFGKVGTAAAAGLAVAIYLAEVLWSRWWMSRFRFGPVEWLWRTLTYGARQPMRKTD